ncbi:hypothetical protein [Tropicibacter naphthalenivorans]|uniref:Uncharacterized protein n=1 Tax=Tropicibacter naphthalenivorans TaxID=441103 RepID=A0A0P1GED3_9RHOB|nr:hypothetical protein [Tropicibacter naphthalenivorans]CUH79696.1 hypothetical protein TRN7648_02602 [Tropicibacter naphthalenivorans]SMC74526.1 hypothetical protein SAMN04488093_103231 [Tropicibacter naphthalenivorans]
MKRLFVALFVLVWPSSLVAQSIAVRSGDHADFTRLVVDLPDGSDWSISDADAGRTKVLRLSRPGLSFDIGDVFSRISRDRIVDLDSPPQRSELRIELGCACEINAYSFKDKMLVLDVQNGPALSPAPEVVAVDTSAPEEISPVEVAELPEPETEHLADADHVAPEPIQEPRPQDAATHAPAGLAEVRLGEKPGIGPERQQSPLMPGVTMARPQERSVAPHDAEPVKEPDLAQHARGPLSIGDQIIADLAAAATQGLLDPAISPDGGLKIDHVAVREAEQNQLNAPDLTAALSAGLAGVEYSASGSQRIAIGGDSCVPESSLNFARWAPSESEPSKALSSARSAVFGEFDRVDESALTKYMRLLNFYTFGVEARAMTQLSEEAPDPTILALSYLVDLEDDPTDHFANQSGCEGSAALWSVMDMETLPMGGKIDPSAVMRAFDALPRHVREHIGPTLADKLGQFGQTDTAKDVLRRLERAQGTETDQIALGRARLDAKTGDPHDAAKTLQKLAMSGGPDTPTAILAAVDAADETKEPVPAAFVELSAAFATEMRNSEQGPEMWDAYVRLLLINGEFDQAYEAIADAPDIPESDLSEMRDKMLKALLTSDNEVAFLKYTFKFEGQGHEVSSPDLTLSIAKRMLASGLPDAALDQLDHLPETPPLLEARLLHAEALLDLSRPEEAELLLSGRQGPEVDRLRAEARRLMGDHEFAKTVYNDLGAEQDALNAAWLSGDWADVAEARDSALAPAAELTQQEQTVVNPQDLSLQDAERLSSESADARETLRALLEATRIEARD